MEQHYKVAKSKHYHNAVLVLMTLDVATTYTLKQTIYVLEFDKECVFFAPPICCGSGVGVEARYATEYTSFQQQYTL